MNTPRRFAVVNMAGFYTVLAKEIRRFAKVWVQTVLTPVVTAVLYLLVFAHVLEGRAMPLPGVNYTLFLVPGLIMMSVLQNSFANSSSSLIQSKMNGSLVFLLLAPLSVFEIWAAYILAAIVRGLLVGSVLYGTALCFTDVPVAAVGWIATFAVLGGAVAGVMGFLAGIISEKFDHLSAFQNFVILPLTFLSGVFYSLSSLPELWQGISKWNPFFYMIDGFRYGFLGISDVSPWFGVTVVGCFFVLLSAVCWVLLARGYRMRG